MVDGISMTPTLHNGDVAIVKKQSSYQLGDIIAYRVPVGETAAGTEVIHRIVGGNGTDGFVTRGDHNPYDDPLWRPKTTDVIGKLWFHVPHVLRLITWLHSPLGLATIVGTLTFVFVALPPRRAHEQTADRRIGASPGGPGGSDEKQRDARSRA
jgi:signal peptidase I